MRKALFLLFFLISNLCYSTTPDYIFICIGQSNMVGKGAEPYNTASDGVYRWNDTAWISGADPQRYAGYGGSTWLGSIWPSCGSMLVAANPGKTFGALNGAVDATGLVAYWSTASVTNAIITAAKNACDGDTTKITGILWIGQEADMQGFRSYGLQDSYFRYMLTNIRTQYKNIPFYYLQTYFNNQTLRYTLGVMDAQLYNDRPDSNIFMSGVTIPLVRQDDAHLTTGSLKRCGKMLANAILYKMGKSTYYHGATVKGTKIINGKVYVSFNQSVNFKPNTSVTGLRLLNGTDSVGVTAKLSGQLLEVTPLTALTSRWVRLNYFHRYTSGDDTLSPIVYNDSANTPAEPFDVMIRNDAIPAVDLTKYDIIVAPACWKLGNAPYQVRTGNFPTANGTATFNYGADVLVDGVTLAGYYNGHFTSGGWGGGGEINLGTKYTFTDTDTLVFEIWRWKEYLNHDQFIFSQIQGSNDYFYLKEGSSAYNTMGTLQFDIAKGGTVKSVITTACLAAGVKYHIVVKKVGSAIDIYVNGTKCSYTQQDAYNLGDCTPNGTFRWGGADGFYFYGPIDPGSQILWAATSTKYMSDTTIMDHANLDETMGYTASNSGDVMTFTSKTIYDISTGDTFGYGFIGIAIAGAIGIGYGFRKLRKRS